MGTLEPPAKIKFDGTPKSWPTFKEAMLKKADSDGYVYMLEGGHGLCAIFQAASATAAKKASGAVATRSDAKGTISLNITTYKDADIKAIMTPHPQSGDILVAGCMSRSRTP